MGIHDKNINKSIDINIIGTAILLKYVQNLKLNLFSFQQIMFTHQSQEFIMKMIVFYQEIHMHGQN